jgi:hypothetical protein
MVRNRKSAAEVHERLSAWAGRIGAIALIAIALIVVGLALAGRR